MHTEILPHFKQVLTKCIFSCAYFFCSMTVRHLLTSRPYMGVDFFLLYLLDGNADVGVLAYLRAWVIIVPCSRACISI